MVSLVVFMSFLGFHYVMEILVSGIIEVGGINLVCLICFGVKCAFTMFL